MYMYICIYVVPTLDNDNTTGYNKTIAASESRHIRPCFFFFFGYKFNTFALIFLSIKILFNLDGRITGPALLYFNTPR